LDFYNRGFCFNDLESERINGEEKMKINWKILIVSLVIVYSMAFVGSLFTSVSVNTDWYDSIKPSITPQSYVFPIVWNILFFLIGLSLYIAWTSARDKDLKRKVAIVFGANLFLNTLWSFIFFGMQNTRLAFFELIIFWISIASMIYVTYSINKKSSYLLIPYLLWVSFAGILNYLITFS
jgi:translocator protein